MSNRPFGARRRSRRQLVAVAQAIQVQADRNEQAARMVGTMLSKAIERLAAHENKTASEIFEELQKELTDAESQSPQREGDPEISPTA